jgi:hypothetical protein
VRRGSVIIRFKLPTEKHINSFFKKFNTLLSKELKVEDAWLADDTINDKENQNVDGVFYVEGTPKTPLIKLDPNTGLGFIKGRSIPENSTEFYKPAYDWLSEFNSISSNKKFELSVHLDYFNSTSSKCILDIFMRLGMMFKEGWDIKVNWYYEEDDEDMLLAGEDFKRLSRITFNLIEKSD